MMLLSIIISFIYFGIIISFAIGFNKLKIVHNKNISDEIKFSIIIPFRNEEKKLPTLLNAFSNLNYANSLFEVLLINDDSSDDFKPSIENFKTNNPEINLRLINTIRNTNSPKKDAINTAINSANFDWIITTDADCEVPINWLKLFNQGIIKKGSLLICAPVKFKQESSFLYHFQNFNFISLIGSTIGSFGIKKPIMCNGANLCYNKNAFIEAEGFKGNSNIASGDDVFLLEKFNKLYPNKVHYLKSKDAIVKTAASTSFNTFLHQQIRWASKSGSYKNRFTKLVGISVFGINLLLIILFTTSIITSTYWVLTLIIFISKIMLDFLLISKTSNFLNNNNSPFYYLITSFIYPFFIVFVGFTSLFKTYNWKGRNFKK